MTMWRNRSDFEASLKDAYEASGLLDQEFSGHALGKVIWATRDEAKIIVPTSTEVGLSIVDDLVSDAILWCNLFYALLLNDTKSKKPVSSFSRSISALFAKITQDSIVIRDLIERGYDVQARNSLRSLEEHIDLALYLVMNPSVCDEFIQTRDEISAKGFWHKYTRKIATLVDQDLATLIDDPSISETVAFRRAERPMLSAVHHPSYWACTMLMFSPHSPSNVLNNIFGIRSEFSFRTGKSLFFNLAFLIVVSRHVSEEIEAFISALSDDDEFQVFVKAGEKYFARMLLELAKNWSAPIFDDSKELKEFLEGLPD